MNICVFGAASDSIDPGFFALGEALGREIAKRGHTLVFGGGAHGLMGAAARGCREKGGRIVGVAPWFFDAPGILLEDSDEMIRVDTMSERKTVMEQRSDAFIALPGGVGTLEEVYEMITLRSLGRHRKPVAFLDHDGYWLPAAELLNRCVEKGFASAALLTHFGYFTDPAVCLDALEKETGK